MEIVRITGGLGNQMFQYAFALWLSSKGHSIKLDTTFYDLRVSESKVDQFHNGFELDRVFYCNLPTATKEEIYAVSSYKPDILHKIQRRLFGLKKTHIKVDGNKRQGWFDPELQFLHNCFFDGYWMTFRYSEEIEEIVRKAFDFSNTELNYRNKHILQEIEDNESVSLHVHHGDYLKLSNYRILSTDYYNRAISKIKGTVKKPVIYCFSDDLDWCKDNLKYENIRFVDWNTGKDSYIDMYLISRCKHNIIANSTFSMWAAWLNNNSSKIVIRPDQYYQNIEDETIDLWPDDWISIESNK